MSEKLSFRFKNKYKILRSLKELYVEGNQLRYMPKEFLQLKLSYFNCSSNLLHKVFWKESCPNKTQSLFGMSINMVLSYNILDWNVLNDKLNLTLSIHLCDYCNRPNPLKELAIIKPVIEIFSAKNLPILFHVCSQMCRNQLTVATQVPLFVDANGKGTDFGEA